MAVWCDYCDMGNVQVEGWHMFPELDVEELDNPYRVPCAIWPPAVETVSGP